MIRRIIAVGQNEAALGAVAAATRLGIPCKGMSKLPDTRWDADGTVIITRGFLSKALKKVSSQAKLQQHPCLYIDLDETLMLEAASQVHAWSEEFNIQDVNVTGDTDDKGLFKDTTFLIEGAILLGLSGVKPGTLITELDTNTLLEKLPIKPRTVEDAVNKLISEIDHKSMFAIANLKGEGATGLYCAMEQHIKSILGLNLGNLELLKACEDMLPGKTVNADEASALIFLTMCSRLQKTHKVRIVK